MQTVSKISLVFLMSLTSITCVLLLYLFVLYLLILLIYVGEQEGPTVSSKYDLKAKQLCEGCSFRMERHRRMNWKLSKE